MNKNDDVKSRSHGLERVKAPCLFVAVQLTAKPHFLLAGHLQFLCRLTFELSGRQRQDAKPGLVKMYEYHQPRLGAMPLVLRLSEGLGRTLDAASVLFHFFDAIVASRLD